MTPQEDTTAKALPDLVPQGNGVYASPFAYPHALNTAVQKVSEGTQTTPKPTTTSPSLSKIPSTSPSSPKTHSPLPPLPSHPHSRQHPSSPPPSPPQPPAHVQNNNNNEDSKDDTDDPVPLSPLPQVQPNGTNGIYSDPGPFQLDPPLQQRQPSPPLPPLPSSPSPPMRAFTPTPEPPSSLSLTPWSASETQPITIAATSLSSSSTPDKKVPAPAVTGLGAQQSPASLGSLPAPDQQHQQQQQQQKQREQGAVLPPTSTNDTEYYNTLASPIQASATTGVPPADSLAERHPAAAVTTPTPFAPPESVAVIIPVTVDVDVNVNVYINDNNSTVTSTPPPSSSYPAQSVDTPSIQLFLSQHQQQLKQLQQEPQNSYRDHQEQQQPIVNQQQPLAVEIVQNDLLLQQERQQQQTQLQVQSQLPGQGQVQIQEGQPQQPQSIPVTPQSLRDIGPMVPPKSPGTPFGPPARASTMEVRRIRPGSQLLTESAVRSQQQPDSPQGESSSRARHRQIYRRNTYSADLGSTSFRRSDDEMEMDELEDAKRRMEALKKSSSRRMSKRKKDEDNDRVLIGTRIGEDHVNYVLMYNMLTGIRVSVSRCNAKPQRMLVDEDFTAAHKLAFDITGNELTPSSKYDFKFKDYAPWVFRHLREDFHIDASDYLVSLTSKYILSELGSPGKSGSFFYFSQDYRFIIKTIHHAEHKFMRKILKDYFNHVKQNPHTLLCRFFGLHRVKLPHGRKIHFVVMGNVFPPNRDIHETYDLKGSTLGRAISDEELANNPRATQKDLNWVNRNRKLELGPEKRHLFVEQIKRDVELLSRLNIMDYSLLIGIHDIARGNKDNIRDNTLKVFHPDTSKPLARETTRKDKRESKVNALRMAVKVSDPQALGPTTLPSDSFSERRHFIFYADDGGLLSTNEQNEQGEDLYYLGIIDILTPYNYVKKIEHAWKSLTQDKHAISAVNPREYASRFLSFMIHAIKVNHDVMAALQQSSQNHSHPHSE
ncbi:Phosphatidylinositol-4-phosphate 5-kinase [Linnemannia elongata]|nr:Phosphatidylinositol-4-phosphate 5-kinase [Linnemannia elongata]